MPVQISESLWKSIDFILKKYENDVIINAIYPAYIGSAIKRTGCVFEYLK